MLKMHGGMMKKNNAKPKKHMVIPDCQVTPDTPTDHLRWIGEYMVEKKPDVVVCLGDFADMESLSSYDFGKKCYEGRRYNKDIVAAKDAMKILMKPLDDYNRKRIKNKKRKYSPDLNLTIGNHEHRIIRAVESDSKLDGFMSIDNLEYESFGWKVHDFLEVFDANGVHYSHYFANTLSGRPYGGENIGIRLKNIGLSFIMGHQQIYMLGVKSLSNGKRIRGLVQGSCYLHDEYYRGPQSNNEWRGVFILHEVVDGDYSLMEVSLEYLCRRYEGMPVWQFMKKKHPKIFKKSIWMKRQEHHYNNHHIAKRILTECDCDTCKSLSKNKREWI